MLFKSLQEHSGDGAMSDTQVFNALTAYSRDYLLPEIKDELDGYIDGDHIKANIPTVRFQRAYGLPWSNSIRLSQTIRLPP